MHYLTQETEKRKFKNQIGDIIEKWKDSKSYNRIKGFYYQNIAHFPEFQSSCVPSLITSDHEDHEINSKQINDTVIST